MSSGYRGRIIVKVGTDDSAWYYVSGKGHSWGSFAKYSDVTKWIDWVIADYAQHRRL